MKDFSAKDLHLHTATRRAHPNAQDVRAKPFGKSAHPGREPEGRRKLSKGAASAPLMKSREAAHV